MVEDEAEKAKGEEDEREMLAGRRSRNSAHAASSSRASRCRSCCALKVCFLDAGVGAWRCGVEADRKSGVRVPLGAVEAGADSGGEGDGARD